MAQAVERILGKDEVGGSIPPSSSNPLKLKVSRDAFFTKGEIIMGKFISNIKKSMFERINGVDIEKIDTTTLLTNVKMLPTIFIIMVFCVIAFDAFGVMFVFVGDSDSDFVLISLLFFGFSLISLLLSFMLPIRLKNIKAALSTRDISDEARKNAQDKVNTTKVVAIISIVIFVALTIAGIFGAFGNTGGHSDNKCQVCEIKYSDSKNKKSIAKTNMCKNCYENYKSLEWVLDE